MENAKKNPMQLAEKYAVTVKDSKKIFRVLEITRSLSSDVYINFNKRGTKHAPHSSYHASGQLHHKGYNKILLPIRKKQPPTNSFTGTENIITTSIRRGDAQAWNISINPDEYTAIMEIPDKILSPEFGYQLSIDLVDPRAKTWTLTYPHVTTIRQKIFKQNRPWIVISLYETQAVIRTIIR